MSDIEDLDNEFGGNIALGSDAMPQRMRKRRKSQKRPDHYIPVDQRPIAEGSPVDEEIARRKVDNAFQALLRAEHPALEGKKPTLDSVNPRTIGAHVDWRSKGLD